ncbi:MAG: sigma 54-interacting transcriptional regulator [Myxococcota bacterium]
MSDATIPSRTVGKPVRILRVTVTRGKQSGLKVTGHDEPITVGSAEDNTIVLRDRTVSRYHAELQRHQDRVRLTDLGSTNGTQVGSVMVKQGSVTVAPSACIQLGNSEITVSDGETIVVQQPVWEQVGGILGRSPAIQHLMGGVARLAHKVTPVLILGESGTGKELIARALHDLGPRADKPFVTVECGSLTSTLFASEVFGHERGAFTGAVQARAGAFERADGGTLFLDEVGELPLEQQTALLGVLERRRVRRVGGQKETPVDVRVIAATNRDLRAEVNSGAFRLDLYYRIAVVLLSVPPLRERAEDIPLLIEQFLSEEGDESLQDELFDAGTIERLTAYRWPGNVRELRNVVAAAVATGHPELVEGPGGAEGPGSEVIEQVIDLPYKRAKRTVTEEFERRYLVRLLERAGGGVRPAARLAGIDRTYLSNLLKRHNLR